MLPSGNCPGSIFLSPGSDQSIFLCFQSKSELFGDALRVYTHGPMASLHDTSMISLLTRISGALFASLGELRSGLSFVARIRIGLFSPKPASKLLL